VRSRTGLGLAISRGLSSACAAISVRQSHRRGGAVLTSACLPSPAGREGGHRRMNAAPIKVMVIDDETPIRKLLRMGLSTAS